MAGGRTVWLTVVLLVALGAAWAGLLRAVTGQNGGTAARTAEDDADALDPDGCGACHSAEVRGYERSAMAHSLRRAREEPSGVVEVPGTTITVISSAAGTRQILESHGTKAEYTIAYEVGSGRHARGYLVDVANHLFQSPISYYQHRHSYDLAPGYEGRADPDFTRAIAPGCLFCHAGGTRPVTGTANEYQPAPFTHLSIGCDRCHGPTANHLADPEAGTIVNPAELQGAIRDSVCEQCHLMGVARVLNPGKQMTDYRPGTALEDTFTIYRNEIPAGMAARFRVISHAEQLRLSMCARKSSGRLWCGSCHDPHQEVLNTASYYRAKCLVCHRDSFPKMHPAETSDCIGCHMPKRNAADGGHTAFTDHRIQRRPEPEEPLTDSVDIAAWREPEESLRLRNLGIAYVQVGIERQSPAFIVRGYRMLTAVQVQFSRDPEVYSYMGTALMLAKQYGEAEQAYARAVGLDRGSAVRETNLGQALVSGGDLPAAEHYLEDALTKDPLELPAVTLLMNIYDKEGDAAKAEELSEKIRAEVK